MIKRHKLSVGFINPRSLGTRHEEFIVAVDRQRFDVIAINETWLRNGEEGRAPILPGYRLYHIPRSTQIRSRGGGVGFYIKCDINFQIISHPVNAKVEQMWIKITASRTKILIGTAYRPPWLNVQIFLDALADTIGSFQAYDCFLFTHKNSYRLFNRL